MKEFFSGLNNGQCPTFFTKQIVIFKNQYE